MLDLEPRQELLAQRRREEGHVLHARVGKVLVQHPLYTYVFLVSVRSNLLVAHIFRLAQAYGKGLPVGVVVDEQSALPAVVPHAAQRLDPLEGQHDVGSARLDEGAVGSLSDAYVGADDSSPLGQTMCVDGPHRTAGVVVCAHHRLAQKADALAPDAAELYTDSLSVGSATHRRPPFPVQSPEQDRSADRSRLLCRGRD